MASNTPTRKAIPPRVQLRARGIQTKTVQIHTAPLHPANHLTNPLEKREQVGQLESPGSPHPPMQARPCIIAFLIDELLILVAL